MLDRLYPIRFQLFFFSLMAILFGSLVVPASFFEGILAPILFLLNLMAGIILLSTRKKIMWFFVVLLVITGVTSGASFFDKEGITYSFVRMAAYFLFYTVVTAALIRQVWKANKISENVILGLISGYVSLGLIGFFICLSIEMAYPNSFHGFNPDVSSTDNLMYFSYITLLTIGYGDMAPATTLARKASILIGLLGQIYLVILTAIVVGKYINQKGVAK